VKRVLLLAIILIFINCENKEKISEEDIYHKNLKVYNKKDNKLFNGFIRNNYPNSDKLYFTLEYKNGIKNGNSTWYFKNGQIRQIVPYKNNQADGAFREYYENGNIKTKMNYKENKVVGDVELFNEDGKLIKKIDKSTYGIY
jgi:antitoxin component YwqK of YwqJK toxin-antitoxin module